MPGARVAQLATVERRLLASLGIAQGIIGSGMQAAARNRRLQDILHETAFMRAFIAWERFLEETFLGYLMGQRGLNGRACHRFYTPPNGQAAREFLRIASGRRGYLDWTEPSGVIERAEAVFRGGGCFVRLRLQSQVLQDMKRVRNAISHDSDDARAKFEELVRRELTTLPRGCTPGRFLRTRAPAAQQPGSFFDGYVGSVQALASVLLRP